MIWYSGSDDGLAKEINDVSGSDDVRPPLPVIREALYDDSMLYGYFTTLFF